MGRESQMQIWVNMKDIIKFRKNHKKMAETGRQESDAEAFNRLLNYIDSKEDYQISKLRFDKKIL